MKMCILYTTKYFCFFKGDLLFFFNIVKIKNSDYPQIAKFLGEAKKALKDKLKLVL